MTALVAGSKVGAYEILALLGAGGMGEVYRARDTRLDREVAVKVLNASFSNDPYRLKRFEQEARATSALNHPNILSIYDVGKLDGMPYLVTELLEGEDLRAILNGGRLPARKAIDYAMQIAHGLAMAHGKGIIHRDLKPENLFINKDGRVKILDFGLAKLRQLPVETMDNSDSAEQKQITGKGAIMGTVSYMPPEQVRGQEADHRADIFAFGLILYEMLSGRRAFQRDSQVEVMYAILHDEPPDLNETGRKFSAALVRIVQRCLEKQPVQRFQNAADLGFALEALSTPSDPQLDLGTVSRPSTKWSGSLKAWLKTVRPNWIVVACLLTGLLLTLLLGTLPFRQKPPADEVAMRFAIALPERAAMGRPVISPNGNHLVYAATVEGKTQLWLRPMNSMEVRPLPDTEGVNGFPFWSPDSRFIGFVNDGKLIKMDPLKGTYQVLCKVPGILGDFSGAWNHEGTILLFGGGLGDGIVLRASAEGGEPVPLPGIDQPRRGAAYRWPSFLPDGSHFIYLVTDTQHDTSDIYLASLDGKESKLLLAAGSSAIYAASPAGAGYLIFARDEVLLAQQFDDHRLAITGESFRIADKVRVNINSLGSFSVSDNGTLVFDPRGDFYNQRLAWFDRTGRQLGLIGAVGNYGGPRLSPDDGRVAVQSRDAKAGSDISLIELAKRTSSKFTFDPAEDFWPLWSPDGKQIIWASNREGIHGIYRKLVSGLGRDELLLKSEVNLGPTDWSADGRFILCEQSDPITKIDLWVLPVEGDRRPFPLLHTPYNEASGRFSPDGRWIAYDSDESRKREVYVQSFPALGGKFQVSDKGGYFPRWRRDGKEMFYLSGDGKLMVVEVKTDSTFEKGIPQVLFDLAAAKIPLNSIYAVTTDGQRFIFRIEETAPPSLAVMVNWSIALRK
jgi:eukaryotic-like serine/threonine-protein kinase